MPIPEASSFFIFSPTNKCVALRLLRAATHGGLGGHFPALKDPLLLIL